MLAYACAALRSLGPTESLSRTISWHCGVLSPFATIATFPSLARVKTLWYMLGWLSIELCRLGSCGVPQAWVSMHRICILCRHRSLKIACSSSIHLATFHSHRFSPTGICIACIHMYRTPITDMLVNHSYTYVFNGLKTIFGTCLNVKSVFGDETPRCLSRAGQVSSIFNSKVSVVFEQLLKQRSKW
ncbi:hypothetical protein FA15DRAFT_501402 [Coprinopsis marcescibilis]|uniref:Uncharacterized protein n=1 Tax=Coprinopsis marcescibilis TaxID=230819 RepID=A0A5C3KR69_COPMA|nr:hypothetical protein FA15DRAFT_501402 [Coprinopsis marcescibilis]